MIPINSKLRWGLIVILAIVVIGDIGRKIFNSTFNKIEGEAGNILEGANKLPSGKSHIVNSKEKISDEPNSLPNLIKDASLISKNLDSKEGNYQMDSALESSESDSFHDCLAFHELPLKDNSNPLNIDAIVEDYNINVSVPVLPENGNNKNVKIQNTHECKDFKNEIIESDEFSQFFLCNDTMEM